MIFGLLTGSTRSAFQVHLGAITFPPEVSYTERRSTCPSASPRHHFRAHDHGRLRSHLVGRADRARRRGAGNCVWVGEGGGRGGRCVAGGVHSGGVEKDTERGREGERERV